MWSRANLKANAKVAFKRNYWKCVLVALILGIAVGSSGSGSSVSSVNQNTENILSEDHTDDNFTNEYYEEDFIEKSFSDIFASGVSGIVATIGIVILLIVVIIAIVLGIFVFGPLEVGCRNYFKTNAYEQAELNTLTIGFKKNHYMKMVGTIFFRNLYIALWSLLLVVPGIIKSYEYRMIPYILADCPDIPRQEAFRISKEMMYGHKMNTFILDLSFIGWSLLSVITCGIAGVFYVNPYVAATDAELFIAIREEYFKGQSVA